VKYNYDVNIQNYKAKSMARRLSKTLEIDYN
jgi:hypothetical protein